MQNLSNGVIAFRVSWQGAAKQARCDSNSLTLWRIIYQLSLYGFHYFLMGNVLLTLVMIGTVCKPSNWQCPIHHSLGMRYMSKVV
jgi:hypothetical protein